MNWEVVVLLEPTELKRSNTYMYKFIKVYIYRAWIYVDIRICLKTTENIPKSSLCLLRDSEVLERAWIYQVW